MECKKIKICFNRQTYQSEMESSHRWPLSKPAHKRCVAKLDCNIDIDEKVKVMILVNVNVKVVILGNVKQACT